MTCSGAVAEATSRRWSSKVDSWTVSGRELGMESSSMWMPFGVYLGYTSLSSSVLEPGGAYPATDRTLARTRKAQSIQRQITHVDQFALKDDEHQALGTVYIQRLTASKSSVRRTLYAHNAIGRPTNADRTSQPDGASSLGCSRRPEIRRVLVTAQVKTEGRELEPEMGLVCA
jgi:hypothetical protein